MPEDDLVDIKFRLYDGTDVGPFSYSSASTVDMLKQRVVSDWPKGKTMTPKTANEVKLMSFGKILENNKTVGQCKLPLADIGGGIIVMHVVVQPAIEKAKTENHVVGDFSSFKALVFHHTGCLPYLFPVWFLPCSSACLCVNCLNDCSSNGKLYRPC
ncbi:hypothetical protein DVH24_008484 [Malus domestica]|uniref:Ubiquitin-like domain-containing protein n=1 Tax=Malus domestica TaxID=3750 RepID=A0A498JQ54_MALDO|nr:hypothetical protein DVH24_008484 [Malus domestica]